VTALIDGEGYPTICDAIYGTVAADSRGQVAVLYWARSHGYGAPLILLDWDVALLTAARWAVIDGEIGDLVTRCRARGGSLGLWIENEALAQQANARGCRAKAIPEHLTATDYWDNLSLVAGQYIDDGSVKVTRTVAAKIKVQPFGALPRRVPGPRADDATVPAWLYGIVLGLDEAAANPPEPNRVKLVA
jgi:hypothetical protein